MKISKTILEKALFEITPSDKDHEKEREILKDIMHILSSEIAHINPKVEPIMVGSIAKGTDLKDDKDFDIFLQFPKNTSRENLEAQGLAIGRRFFSAINSKPELNYAEHPYVKGKYKDYEVEIVPCYKLEAGDKIMSAVDRSPFHTNFVLSQLKKKPILRDDIRLLKRFMKANGIYGAHATVEGFSGYLCELLVLSYGSFGKVIDAGSKWQKGEKLKIGKGKSKSFSDSPLVFIDPVDSNRNVAAAVSIEKLGKFIYLCNAFVRHPNKSFLYSPIIAPMSKKEFYRKVHKRGTELIAISFNAPELIEDTLVPQLAKSLKAMAAECERTGFVILKKGHWTDGKKVVFLLEFEISELPRVMKKQGPYFDSKVGDMRGFIESNKSKAVSSPYIEGEHWNIDVERQFRHVDDLITNYLKEPKGFGKNLRDIKKFTMKVNSEINDISEVDFWKFMSEFY